jgi:putative flippase GtrA
VIGKELRTFLVVGGLTVVLDYAVYRGLLALALTNVPACKALGFVAGMVFAYWANRQWTFSDAPNRRGSAWRFVVVYLFNLGMNVAVNSLLLNAFAGMAGAVSAAFVVATGVSASLNFAGMKWFVFTNAANEKGGAL